MKGRINYIDSAKGICILLVMMIHIGVQEPIPNIYAVKVPLFFVLSGYFIKDEILPIKVYLAKTIKRLLIPFLFFYLLSYIVYYVGCYAYPPMRELTEARGILDCITQKQYFNGPLWFLLSLFFVQITVNLVQRVTDNEWVRTIVFLLMGCSGFILSRAEIDLPIAIDTSLVAIPMFWIGHYLHRFEVFEKKGTWKYFVPACLVVYIIPIFTPPLQHIRIAMSVNRYSVDIVFLYLFTISASILIVYLSKWLLNKDKCFSYIGRNSLLLLCTHHMIYRPVYLLDRDLLSTSLEPYITFFITLCICLLLVPLFDRWMPWAIGKRVLKQKLNR